MGKLAAAQRGTKAAIDIAKNATVGIAIVRN